LASSFSPTKPSFYIFIKRMPEIIGREFPNFSNTMTKMIEALTFNVELFKKDKDETELLITIFELEGEPVANLFNLLRYLFIISNGEENYFRDTIEEKFGIDMYLVKTVDGKIEDACKLNGLIVKSIDDEEIEHSGMAGVVCRKVKMITRHKHNLTEEEFDEIKKLM